jgi:hypothetical protein
MDGFMAWKKNQTENKKRKERCRRYSLVPLWRRKFLIEGCCS